MNYLKYRTHDIELEPFSGGYDGYFEFETFKGVEFPKGSGNVFEFAGTRKKHQPVGNLITNYGLDNYGNGRGDPANDSSRNDAMHYCHVGTGNTPPSVGDTSLGTWVASVVRDGTDSYGCTTVAPIYGWRRAKYRFAPGFASGAVNLNEVGISHATGSSAALGSKALTEDDQGDPATVPVLADEYLDVYYTRRNYPAYVDEATGLPVNGSGTVVVGGVTYNYTIRPSLIGQTAWGSGASIGVSYVNGYNWNITTPAGVFEATSEHGGITGVPTGSYDASGNWGSYENEPYQDGTYSRLLGYHWGLDNGNVTGGIGAILLKMTIGCYSMVFDNPIPKDNTKLFSFYQNVSWARKTLP